MYVCEVLTLKTLFSDSRSVCDTLIRQLDLGVYATYFLPETPDHRGLFDDY